MLLRRVVCLGVCVLLVFLHFSLSVLQAQSPSWRASPAWESYFQQRVSHLKSATEADLASVTPENWSEKSEQWRGELQEMLGLAPWPAKTDLKVTSVGSVRVEGVRIERIHYQASPGLYVTADLYRPQAEAPDTGWPAVLYVCGHARVTDKGRLLGNKTSYQHHGLWFARHGVVCLMIDTVQLGELHGEHHGTYKLGRWDWISRGYTPGGVEAWNAIRGVDLLTTLPDVDGQRIGVTGRSGGGVYSWYAAALDERIKAAVPVAGITDLRNYVIDGCVEGHCDCMFFVNYFGWDYYKMAALVAPRALLLANSDRDDIFPLDGVMRTHRQLKSLYRSLDAEDRYGVIITPGPHKDTQELQVGAFKFLLKHLTGEEPVIDSAAVKEVAPERLAVFTAEAPRDERVTSVGRWFVELAKTVDEPNEAAEMWQKTWYAELQRLGAIPQVELLPQIAPQLVVISDGRAATAASDGEQASEWELWTDERTGIHILKIGAAGPENPPMIHAGVADQSTWNAASAADVVMSDAVQQVVAAYPEHAHYFVQWRGATWLPDAGSVKRMHQIVRRFYLIGTMPEVQQLSDLLAVLAWLKRQSDGPQQLVLAGAGRVANLMLLTALTAKQHPQRFPTIGKLRIDDYRVDPMLAPSLPGILRVCDYASLLAAARGSLEVQTLAEPPSAVEAGQKQVSADLLVDTSSEPQQANGMRIVEVDQDSAHIWVRATRWPLPNLGDLPKVEFAEPARRSKRNVGAILPESGVDGLRFAVPGVPAEVRVGYRANDGWQYSDWQPVDHSTDYSALVRLADLQPGTSYSVRTQVRPVGGQGASSTLAGSFRTLPAETMSTDFRLAVSTCQAFIDRDGPHGFDLYRTVLERGSDAFIMAGDVVYYDSLARNTELAYYHWQRTYSLPTLEFFHRRVPSYFLKDDHDTYVNDSWPGTRFGWTGDFTFEDGQRIFIQETGLPTPAYRTFKLGKDLQIWLMEGRDFRSPNDAPDGPEKSIWGAEQKAWLKATLDASTAKFKVIISPTPIVGPDRENKRDNHANKVFAAEGEQVRQMLASYPNLVTVCGDRHWQFHSIDPKTGLNEFSVGPASDRHAGGWNQSDFRPEIHQFLRVGGGYLEVDLSTSGEQPELTLRHLDTHGNEQYSHRLR